jgi:DNA-binding FrmR family transcriptional regulator
VPQAEAAGEHAGKGGSVTPEEKDQLQRIEGQIAAIGMALNLLIEGGADPAAFSDAIRNRSERLQARLLASHVPDAVREAAETFVYQWLVRKH